MAGGLLYTVRELGDDAWSLAKWDQGYKEPLDTYRIRSAGAFQICACPARDPCKHQQILADLRGAALLRDVPLWRLFWEDGIVYTMLDLLPPEQLEQLFAT